MIKLSGPWKTFCQLVRSMELKVKKFPKTKWFTKNKKSKPPNIGADDISKFPMKANFDLP